MSKEYLNKDMVRQSRFPVSLFGIFFLVLLLMSGIHTGLIVGLNRGGVNEIIQTAVPMIYWALVAATLTLFTAWQIRKTYEIPMKNLAKATSEVARGDFSVYLSPIHTPEKLDYLDVMIMDFNKMVEELGSIETLKTDFFSNVSHEIKTPLAVIQSNAQLLQKEGLPEEQRMECTETILHATRRLSSLITNMLKLNKLEKQT
ncbi:MAG: histidine kinase dimerization/phospho-acceptor domain-containing protein, partial [Coprococcus sp.]